MASSTWHPARFLWAATAYLAVFSDAAGQSPPARLDFNRDIRPILADKCFRCHGPDGKSRQADLRLDAEASAKAQRDGQPAIVPGRPDDSLLARRISSADPDERMPPQESGKTLSEKEITTLRRWIEQGAPWAKHWAYVPPRQHAVPSVQNSRWPLNWIDHFILARQESEGLAPSPEADRVTLARRLHFDLLGLPPEPQVVEQFLHDPDALAYERLVDRLLASIHFGERMALYWLDLVRYADTVGYHGDQEHHISPYRDYVIDAFNENIPFDRFTAEQLAGDLLPGSTIDQQIASGYNRLLQTSHEGGVQAKEYLAIYQADRVRNVSAVWLGGTLGCAQCHDHKFDPYTMRDFYSLAAFFADLDEAQHLKKGSDTSPTVRAPERKVLTQRERAVVAALDAQIEELTARLKQLPAEPHDQADALRRQLEQAAAQRQAIDRNARLTMISVAIEPRVVRILPRGNWLDDSGPVVSPAVPEFLGTLPVGGRRGTRLDLARWLTSREHGVGGLTARVLANRLWYLFFGQGLARSLDDLGAQGEPPDHPELLDNLALELLDSGWDIKHLVRLLVTSRAYRQSSHASPELQQRDPDNRFLARQGRYRLPAEMVRDQALAASGLLVRGYGGASVRPYQPEDYYKHLNFPPRTYVPDCDERQWRRGVYVHWQRQYLHPTLKALDAPSREECTAQRPRSNTPLAALALLNDPSFVEAARALAQRILQEGGRTSPQRLELAFRLALSRPPDDREREVLSRLLETSAAHYALNAQAAQQLAGVGQAPLPENIDPLELAAWTAVARVLLNLSESMTRR